MELVDILEKVKVYLRQIKRRWWLVLLTIIGTTILLLMYAVKKEVSYTSKTVFHPQEASSTPTDPLAMLFTGGSGLGSGNQEMQAILESIHLSEMVAADTLKWQGKSISVAKLYKELNPPKAPSIDQWISQKLNALLTEKGEQKEPTFKDSVIQVAFALKRSLLLEENERGMVQMTITSNNPQFLRAISYEYIQKLTDYYKGNRTEKSHDNYRFLAKRTDSVKRELTGAIARGAQYIDQNQFRLLATQEVPLKKTEGEMEILKVMYAQLVTMREAALNQLLQDTPVLQVLDYPNPPYENNKVKLFIFLIIGVVLGFILGIIFSVMGMLKRDIQTYINENLLKSSKTE